MQQHQVLAADPPQQLWQVPAHDALIVPLPLKTKAGGIAEAVDGIVEAFGGGEELFITVNHQPSSVDTSGDEVPKQRVQHLRYAAARLGCADVPDHPAGQDLTGMGSGR